MAINPRNFGMAGGVLWGVSLLVFTFITGATSYGSEFADFLVRLYPGYSITWYGALVGLVYAFLDAFIGLYIFAWLYNLFEKKLGP